MKFGYKFTLVIITYAITSCANRDSKHGFEYWSFLRDSTQIFHNLIIDESRGFQCDSSKIQFISQEEFEDAFLRNYKYVKYFSREHRRNELFTNGAKRLGDSLLVKCTNKFKSFVDNDENSIQRKCNYFLESSCGNYWIIKKIHFEDAETILIDKKTGSTDLKIPHLNVFSDPQGEKVFLSHETDSAKVRKFQVLSLKKNKIDTIFSAFSQSFVNFSFFENGKNKVYLILRQYDNNKVSSRCSTLSF